MSGEAYREWGYYPYIIDDIAFDISKMSPIFGGVLSASNKLIERFNYYRSGDIGIDSLNKAYMEWIKEMTALGWFPTREIVDTATMEESE